jgi:hypothetical protein
MRFARRRWRVPPPGSYRRFHEAMYGKLPTRAERLRVAALRMARLLFWLVIALLLIWASQWALFWMLFALVLVVGAGWSWYRGYDNWVTRVAVLGMAATILFGLWIQKGG